ncbi:Eco47II family restriction endonuclease [Bartonella sp. CB175]|uniref:Eco47II family restriction endonuclease n=1 Tax=Bartonella sp. CB175 TaxID=3112256 RepID=UPI00300E495C
MRNYNLNFIKSDDLFQHVKKTIEGYRFEVDSDRFNKNIVDPIKLTFDAKVYKKNIDEIIEAESMRQIDKTNNNYIGYFQQNIFKYLYNKNDKNIKWIVPKKGFDVINEEDKIYVEIKNKHNTMNSSSSQKTYIKMQDKVLKDSNNKCFLVEIIAKKSQNVKWVVSLNGVTSSNENIRRVSIDKFYEIVTGEEYAFKQLVETLPMVIDDVLNDIGFKTIKNMVLSGFKKSNGDAFLSDNDLLKAIYLKSFKGYNGFDNLNINLNL